jgi:polyhydroxyalkanoate synthase
MGVLSPPVDPPKRRYWMGDATGHDDPDGWLAQVEKASNSWWTDWYAWLKPRCGELRTPPTMGNQDYPQLAPAPGDYVLER